MDNYIDELIKKYPKWGLEFMKRNNYKQSSNTSPNNIPVKTAPKGS